MSGLASGWIRQCRLGSGIRKGVMMTVAASSTEDSRLAGVDIPAGYAVCLNTAPEVASRAEVSLAVASNVLGSMTQARVIYQGPYTPGLIWIHYARPPVTIGRYEYPHGRSPRPAVPPGMRLAVLARGRYRCASCGTASDLTLDHIYPWSRGGTHRLDNLQPLCRSCNSRKGSRVSPPRSSSPAAGHAPAAGPSHTGETR